MQSDSTEKMSLTDKAEVDILNAIREAGYSAGDQLPSEIELAAQLGMSRSVVREALSRLRMLGLLTSRKKRGMVLCEPDVLGAARRVMDPALIQGRTARELFELRLVIEMGMVDLVFLRKTDAGLHELKAIIERQENAKAEELRIQADIDFHAALYRLSGNKTLTDFQSLLHGFFQEVVNREKHVGRKPSALGHQQLLDTLQNGTLEDFRAAMRSHLDPHFETLRNWEIKQ